MQIAILTVSLLRRRPEVEMCIIIINTIIIINIIMTIINNNNNNNNNSPWHSKEAMQLHSATLSQSFNLCFLPRWLILLGKQFPN